MIHREHTLPMEVIVKVEVDIHLVLEVSHHGLEVQLDILMTQDIIQRNFHELLSTTKKKDKNFPKGRDEFINWYYREFSDIYGEMEQDAKHFHGSSWRVYSYSRGDPDLMAKEFVMRSGMADLFGRKFQHGQSDAMGGQVDKPDILDIPSRFQIQESIAPLDLTQSSAVKFTLASHSPSFGNPRLSRGFIEEKYVSEDRGSILTFTYHGDVLYKARGWITDSQQKLIIEDPEGNRLARVDQCKPPEKGLGAYFYSILKQHDIFDKNGKFVASCSELDLKLLHLFSVSNDRGTLIGTISRRLFKQSMHCWHVHIRPVSYIEPSVYLFIPAIATVKTRRTGSMKYLADFARSFPTTSKKFLRDMDTWIRNRK